MRNGPYTLCIPTSDYPGILYRGRYCYEHHLVWWQRTGEVLAAGEVIHHIDGVKTNNSPDNLEKMSEFSHKSEHRKSKHGGYVDLLCFFCGTAFSIELRTFRARVKSCGHTDLCCTRSCQVKKQQKELKKKSLLTDTVLGEPGRTVNAK